VNGAAYSDAKRQGFRNETGRDSEIPGSDSDFKPATFLKASE